MPDNNSIFFQRDFLTFIPVMLINRRSQCYWCCSTGQPGLQGAPGFTGSTGLTGQIGIRGDVGMTGDTGSSGPAGSPGLRGPQGNVGSPGSIGGQGSQGQQGATGATGPTGYLLALDVLLKYRNGWHWSGGVCSSSQIVVSAADEWIWCLSSHLGGFYCVPLCTEWAKKTLNFAHPFYIHIYTKLQNCV